MSRWKQGDTLPDMVIDLFDAARARPDLTQATEIRIFVRRNGVPVWDRVVDGDENGVVTVPLQEADVATPGSYHAKIRVLWPEGRQHYPPADGWLPFTVTR